jgi:hypothetical protein
MTPADLIAIARQDYLDENPDLVGATPEDAWRFKTPFLLREVGNAQREACYRQDLRHLYDATTPEICRITITAGTRAYPLDARILRLADARFASGGVLMHTTQPGLDSHRFDLSPRLATARSFIVQGRTLILDCEPAAGDTLLLSVWRAPLRDPNLTDDLEWTAEPEKLAHWLAHKAFLRPDEDTANVKLAEYHRAAFDTAFGRENSAQARAELLAYPPVISVAPMRRHTPSVGHHCLSPWS